jgi:hypothetical protein
MTNDPPMTHQTKAPVFPSSLVGHWWVIRHFTSHSTTFPASINSPERVSLSFAPAAA